IDSLIYDLDYGGKESGKEKLLKEKLEDEYIKKGGGVLYEELKKINKTEAEKIHRNNTKKIIRTIIRLNNKDKMIPYKEANKLSNEFNFELKVLLPKNYDERKKLYDRIDDRVDKMIEDGLIDEVKNLFKENKSEKSAIYQAIGYKEIIPYLKNEANLEIAIEEIKKNTRHYAKRQITWMKKYLTLQKNL
ncbi:MAG: tRNA (adenosine(37)-N6)-dimethylallyltransferase MiaA, partial [Clostridiales Family XIII bacterium]|nr:tRNA (adenosine(37)-N6)-dimethylallyltransferase MiaA [Clostridiales Family XIII bacterium]